MGFEVLEVERRRDIPRFLGVHPSYLRLSSSMRELFPESIKYVRLAYDHRTNELMILPSDVAYGSIRVSRGPNRVVIACSSLIAKLGLVRAKRLYFSRMSTEEVEGVEGAYIFKVEC